MSRGGKCLTESDVTLSRSDIDVFIWGLSPQEATTKVLSILHGVIESRKRVARRLSMPEPVSVVARSSHAITLLGHGDFRPVQFVLRAYRTPGEVLLGFDIDSCCVGRSSNGTTYASPRGWRAFVTRVNAIDLSRRSPSYESRLEKYTKRGFAVHVGQQFRIIDVDLIKLN